MVSIHEFVTMIVETHIKSAQNIHSIVSYVHVYIYSPLLGECYKIRVSGCRASADSSVNGTRFYEN